MRSPRRCLSVALVSALCVGTGSAGHGAVVAPTSPAAAPVFDPSGRAVSTWRTEAADHLVLTPDQMAALRGPGVAPRVARCVKLNNYWCIKRAGWDGELAADGEGHVAFASAVEGAAVAALLLKRYYVDFDRRSATAIISHWAPAQCGGSPGLLAGADPPKLSPSAKAPPASGRTPEGFNKTPQGLPAPTIAVGLGEATRPMTLDALMRSPNMPPSRTMIGMPRGRGRRVFRTGPPVSLSGCGGDAGRIALYAAKAVVGIEPGPDGDLGLFGADGTPTANLEIMMTNMARVEIGPLGPTHELIKSGIAAAFRPGRNPPGP